MSQPNENIEYDDNGNPIEASQPSGGALRAQLEAAKVSEKEAKDRVNRVERENALLRAGLGDLNEAQTAVLLGNEKNTTPELLKANAVELGFVTAEPAAETPPGAEESAEAQARMSEAAVAGGAAPSGDITKDEVVGWPQDKQRDFMSKRPGDWERLLRGQPVPRSADL